VRRLSRASSYGAKLHPMGLPRSTSPSPSTGEFDPCRTGDGGPVPDQTQPPCCSAASAEGALRTCKDLRGSKPDIRTDGMHGRNASPSSQDRLACTGNMPIPYYPEAFDRAFPSTYMVSHYASNS